MMKVGNKLNQLKKHQKIESDTLNFLDYGLLCVPFIMILKTLIIVFYE